MKKILLIAMMALAATVFAKDQEILDIRPGEAKRGDAPTATEWQAEPEIAAALDKLTDEWAAEVFKGGQAAIDKKLSGVLPGFATDPLLACEIAVLSQYVMTLDCCKGCTKKSGSFFGWFTGLFSSNKCVENERTLWTKSLLKFAKNAKEPDLTNWFLDQIRWCGLPCQAGCVRALAADKDKSVKDFAEMVARELEGKTIGK